MGCVVRFRTRLPRVSQLRYAVERNLKEFMNAAPLHLILVHFPIVLVPVGTFFLLISLFLRSNPVGRSALSLFILAGLLAVPAYLLGEGAEDIAKLVSEVKKHDIHEHEEAALFALISTSVLAVCSALFLFLKRGLSDYSVKPIVGILVLAIFAASTLILTGQRGGMIRHPEAFSANVTQKGESLNDGD